MLDPLAVTLVYLMLLGVLIVAVVAFIPVVVSQSRQLGTNLREYLQREANLTPEDRREVETWIAEMEKLRSQMAASSKPPVASPAAPSLAPSPVRCLSNSP